MFESLLVAIDASPRCEVTLDYVTSLAKRTGASVHVLHVNERVVGGRGATILSAEDAEKLVTSALEQLRSVGVPASGSVLTGSYSDIAPAIAQVAGQRSCDTIVLGSYRRRGLARLCSPRVRERVLRLTHTPVLIAPAPLKVTNRSSLGELDVAPAPRRGHRTKAIS